MSRNRAQLEAGVEEREKDLIDWEFGLTSIQGSVYMSHVIIRRSANMPALRQDMPDVVRQVSDALYLDLHAMSGHPVLGRRCAAMAEAIRLRYVARAQEAGS